MEFRKQEFHCEGGWDESCVTQNDYMARFFRIFNWRSGRPFSFEPITLQIGTLSSYIISTSYLGTPRPHTSQYLARHSDTLTRTLPSRTPRSFSIESVAGAMRLQKPLASKKSLFHTAETGPSKLLSNPITKQTNRLVGSNTRASIRARYTTLVALYSRVVGKRKINSLNGYYLRSFSSFTSYYHQIFPLAYSLETRYQELRGATEGFIQPVLTMLLSSCPSREQE